MTRRFFFYQSRSFIFSLLVSPKDWKFFINRLTMFLSTISCYGFGSFLFIAITTLTIIYLYAYQSSCPKREVIIMIWSLNQVTWPSHLIRHIILAKFYKVKKLDHFKLPPLSHLQIHRPISYDTKFNFCYSHYQITCGHFIGKDFNLGFTRLLLSKAIVVD